MSSRSMGGPKRATGPQPAQKYLRPLDGDLSGADTTGQNTEIMPAEEHEHVLVSRHREQALEELRSRRKKEKKQQRQERVRAAIELRKAGATYATIAKQCGYKDSSAAAHAVRRAISREETNTKQEQKHLQLERLHHMLLVLWPKVSAGDTSAINSALSIWDRIQRAENLDAPMEHNVHVDGMPESKVLVIGGDAEAYKKALASMIDGGDTYTDVGRTGSASIPAQVVETRATERNASLTAGAGQAAQELGGSTGDTAETEHTPMRTDSPRIASEVGVAEIVEQPDTPDTTVSEQRKDKVQVVVGGTTADLDVEALTRRALATGDSRDLDNAMRGLAARHSPNKDSAQAVSADDE